MLKVWAAKKFETEHECQDAFLLTKTLQSVLSPLSQRFHLILSPWINSCSVDALLVYSGGFCILEMKHIRKGESVIATENRWIKGRDGAVKEVMHGGSENDSGPFDQVSRYRVALSDFLRDQTIGVLNLASPTKNYKRFIRGCVVIFPERSRNTHDENQIADKVWFSMCRISDLAQYVTNNLLNDRDFFPEADIEDVILECFGFVPEDGILEKEYAMDDFLNEMLFEKAGKRNIEKSNSKANKRVQNAEKKIAKLEKENEILRKQNNEKQVVYLEKPSDSLDFILNPKNHPEVLNLFKEKLFIGIDFGTSNTTVTMLRYDEEHQCLCADPFKITQSDGPTDIDGLKSHIVPTVIAYSKKDGLIFGKGAKERLLDAKKFRIGINAWTEFKMNVGTSMVYPKTMLSRKKYKNENVAIIETPEDATREFFAFLKKQIDEKAKELNKQVEYLVTVPASFALNQRTGLQKSVEAAGIKLKPFSFLDEPNGAFIGAIAYYITENKIVAKDSFLRRKNFLVFDFGAGTCDISVLSLIGKDSLLIKNSAISRFTALGGRNIDQKIVTDVLLPQIQKTNPNVTESYYHAASLELQNALLSTAEKLKCAICAGYEAGTAGINERPFYFSDKTEGLSFTLEAPRLSRTEFQALMTPFISLPQNSTETQSIFEPIEEALKKANFKKNDIDAVVLVGGSAKNPLIKSKLGSYFNSGTDIIECGDICSLVSRGAAIASLYANGLNHPIITPILSEGIFMQAEEKENVLVISRETQLPITKREFEGGTLRIDTASGTFEIPLYAGDKSRPLGSARFELQNGDAVANDEVHFFYEMTTDKVLRYWITINEREFKGELEYPIASGVISEEQLRYVQVKRDLERAALQNDGIPPRAQLEEIAQSLKNDGFYMAAADCYRDVKRFYSGEHNVHKTELKRAECYREANNSTLELEALESSHQLKPTYTSYWYRSWAASRAFGWKSEQAKQYLKEALDAYPSDLDLQYVEMVRLNESGQTKDAQRITKKLYDAWSKNATSLDEHTLSRFHHVAHSLNEIGTANIIAELLKSKRSGRNIEAQPEESSVRLLRFEENNKF